MVSKVPESVAQMWIDPDKANIIITDSMGAELSSANILLTSHLLIVVFSNETGQSGAIFLHIKEAHCQCSAFGSLQIIDICQVFQLIIHLEPATDNFALVKIVIKLNRSKLDSVPYRVMG